MRASRALFRRVDGAGIAAFRVVFGLTLCAATLRFWAKGWIQTLFVVPDFHFTYYGFRWVHPPEAPWVYVVYAGIAASALGIALGLRTRLSALAFFVLFTWAELFEKAAYLNHYYLVSLLGLLFVVVPTDGPWALTRRDGDGTVPAWAYLLLRAQLSVVYFYAGFAKLNADWMLHAEPLRTWLQAYGHVPLVGTAMATPVAAFAMSWAGAAFDLTVWVWLLWRPTRPWAYAAVVAFHAITGLMFPIGMFPIVMIGAATIFFEPAWPRRFLRRGRRSPPIDAAAPVPWTGPRRAVVAFCAFWMAVQLLVPLRYLAYPGPVNWTEEGFRFAWRVMLIEKTGLVEYRVVTDDPVAEWRVYPRNELSPLQYRMLSTQPDMILEYAHHIADRTSATHSGVHVYADAWVSYDGRLSQRAVDGDVDLAAAPWDLRPAGWILPLRQADPP